MSIWNAIVRLEIRVLLKHYPHQVRDILAEKKAHIHLNPTKKPARAEDEANG